LEKPAAKQGCRVGEDNRNIGCGEVGPLEKGGHEFLQRKMGKGGKGEGKGLTVDSEVREARPEKTRELIRKFEGSATTDIILAERKREKKQRKAASLL